MQKADFPGTNASTIRLVAWREFAPLVSNDSLNVILFKSPEMAINVPEDYYLYEELLAKSNP